MREDKEKYYEIIAHCKNCMKTHNKPIKIERGTLIKEHLYYNMDNLECSFCGCDKFEFDRIYDGKTKDEDEIEEYY